MRQIPHNIRGCEILLEDVAVPKVTPGHLLIQTTSSLISASTERMLTEFGRTGYLSKAGQQREKVRLVLDKIRTDGLGATVQSVMAKLDQRVSRRSLGRGTGSSRISAPGDDAFSKAIRTWCCST